MEMLVDILLKQSQKSKKKASEMGYERGGQRSETKDQQKQPWMPPSPIPPQDVLLLRRNTFPLCSMAWVSCYLGI